MCYLEIHRYAWIWANARGFQKSYLGIQSTTWYSAGVGGIQMCRLGIHHHA